MPEKLLNYEVIRTLGEGAASTIYSVRDMETGRPFALKHVIRAKPKDIRFIEQMEDEYEISRQFTHPNLRRSYDLKIHRSLLMKVTEAFLVMELVEGQPLDVRRPATVLETVLVFMRVAEGLGAMHQLGYVHCDIKPNNILVGSDGDVHVIDFGQSCKIGLVKKRIQGTPDYISPEQVNREPVVVQTDVYNLGATLYWALTGIPIPTLYTTNRGGSNSFLLDTMIKTPAELNPLAPPALSKLVMDCIATRIDKRPADMAAVTTRLELSRHAMQKRPGDIPLDPEDSIGPADYSAAARPKDPPGPAGPPIVGAPTTPA
jgi:serine/threonine-protein kinase